MKNIIILFAFLLTSTIAFAQMQAKSVTELPSIQEEEKTMSKGLNPAFTIILDDIEKSELAKEWKDFTKDLKAKAKQDRKSKEWLSDDAKITSISDNSIDLYADVRYESKEVSSIYVWFDLGGAFVNSATHEDETKAAKKVLEKFIVQVYKHKAEDFLKGEEKTLGGFEKDLKKLEKDKKDYLKKIEEAKETIAKMEKNIEVNIADQEKKQGEIETQKKAVTAADNQVKDFQKMQ